MVVFDADEEVMSRSGGLHVLVEIGERSASRRRAASRICGNQHCNESATTYKHLKSSLAITAHSVKSYLGLSSTSSYGPLRSTQSLSFGRLLQRNALTSAFALLTSDTYCSAVL